jgi:hypothetical protein
MIHENVLLLHCISACGADSRFVSGQLGACMPAGISLKLHKSNFKTIQANNSCRSRSERPGHLGKRFASFASRDRSGGRSDADERGSTHESQRPFPVRVSHCCWRDGHLLSGSSHCPEATKPETSSSPRIPREVSKPIQLTDRYDQQANPNAFEVLRFPLSLKQGLRLSDELRGHQQTAALPLPRYGSQ